MTVLIPDTPKDCPHGERLVFERIERDLIDASWVALHSLGLARHQQKLWGEIDFVLLTTSGIFVLEVKGGRVSCSSGRWVHELAGREPYFRTESPWAQAKTAMYALRNEVRRLAPGLEDLLFGFGVVMPHETFTTTTPETEPRVLLDKRYFHRSLQSYVENLRLFWEETYRERHGKAPRLPTTGEIRRLRQVLRPDIDASHSLGSYLNGLDAELIQLTNQQIKVSRRVASNQRTLVRGRAGTGKTVLAVERARQLSADGASVLYLCFNHLLARHVEEALATTEAGRRVRVSHIHAYYRSIIQQAGMSELLNAERDNPEDFYGTVFPRLFVDSALAIAPEAFDVLVVDEAQDILTPDHLDAFDLLLHGGLRRGRWHLFLDPLQDIFGRASEAALSRLTEAGFTSDELFENCRNTRNVATQTEIISGLEMAIEGAIPGPRCDCVFYADRGDLLMKLGQVVEELLAAGVRPKDIIVLSARRLENSLLANTQIVGGLSLRPLMDSTEGHQLAYSTIQAFKGLERQVVLAVDLEIENDDMAMLLYCGLSRARLILRPFLPDSSRKAYEDLAASFGRGLRQRG